MPLFGPPNVKKMIANRDVEGLIKALDYRKDSSVRCAAAAALGKIGDARAVEGLIKMLDYQKESSSVRCAAAAALGEIGDARAVEPLIAQLKLGFITEAALALGEIGDARAIEPLIAELKDLGNSTRKVAADVLDALGWKPGQDEASALYWLAKSEWDKCAEIGLPAMQPLIREFKYGYDDQEKIALAELLGKIGDAQAVEPLLAALKDTFKSDNFGLRKATADALGKIGAPAVDSLIAILKDKNSHRVLRWETTNILGKIGDTRAVGALIDVFRKSGSDDAASSAGDSLKMIGAPAVDGLISLLPYGIRDHNDHYDEARAAYHAVVLLGCIGDKRAADAVLEALFAAPIVDWRQSDFENLFGDYTARILGILGGYVLSENLEYTPGGTSGDTLRTYAYDVSPMIKATISLGQIPTMIASNILHLISKRRDPMVTLQSGYYLGKGGVIEEPLNLDEQRQMAKGILDQLGNPTYNAEAYLKVEDWKRLVS